MRSELVQGDCLEVLEDMEPETVGAVVTDPPYGIGFMGKKWDQAVPGPRFAELCFRAMKPGAWLGAFAATRTQHRLTCALEDAGFEVRDVLGWVQYQGFPKNQNVGKAWGDDKEGAAKWAAYGTALKPSWEPCVLVRKPLDGSMVENLKKHGTGPINIDACRYPYGDPAWIGPDNSPEFIEKTCAPNSRGGAAVTSGRSLGDLGSQVVNVHADGRWPANLYHCPKPSRSEREGGCEHLPTKNVTETVDRAPGSPGSMSPGAGANRGAGSPRYRCAHCGLTLAGGHAASPCPVNGEHEPELEGYGPEIHNFHPTVKPIQLMRWIVRLLCPPGQLVVDPFVGSGTTGIAAALEQRDFLGIEREADYIPIARARIDHHGRQTQLDFG